MVQLQRIRRKKIGIPVTEPSKFTERTMAALAKDMQSGRVPLERMRIADDRVVGLRASVARSGLITLSVSYEIGDERPHLKLGNLNADAEDHISIEDAREVAKTVKALAARGVNVQDGLLKRLVRELKRDGLNWSADEPKKKRKIDAAE